MISVVIAAYNEASVLGSCLDALLRDSEPGEFEVVVVANGCSDDTAIVASNLPGVCVVEIAQANKSKALNAGDAQAHGFPRIYLDADIAISTQQARSLANAIAGLTDAANHEPLAAVPRRVLDLKKRPMMVRAYYAINSRLPAFRDGLFGRGAIALSAEGRGRFGVFPDMVADDLFLDSLFASGEKHEIHDFATTVAAPLRTRDLVRRLVRVRRGNAAMRLAARAGDVKVQVRPADRSAWFTSVVVPHPRLVPAAVIYVGLSGIAAVLARREPRSDRSWGRDESTRTGPTRVAGTESGVA